MTAIEILDSFKGVCPSIKWDRYIDDDNYFVYYGWIPRDDGKFDFLAIYFNENAALNEVGFITSSAKYSESFSTMTGGIHTACKKIAS